jgi:hypothetical protein
MKTLLFITLLLLSSTASAYCVHYNLYGQCDQYDQYSQEKQERQQNNVYIKPVPVLPPFGSTECQWVLMNNQWVSVCN